jgi:hypothetical protein
MTNFQRALGQDALGRFPERLDVLGFKRSAPMPSRRTETRD